MYTTLEDIIKGLLKEKDKYAVESEERIYNDAIGEWEIKKVKKIVGNPTTIAEYCSDHNLPLPYELVYGMPSIELKTNSDYVDKT